MGLQTDGLKLGLLPGAPLARLLCEPRSGPGSIPARGGLLHVIPSLLCLFSHYPEQKYQKNIILLDKL